MKKNKPFDGSMIRKGMVSICVNINCDNRKMIMDACDYNIKDYPKGTYTPIGVVIMNPRHTHERYGEGNRNRDRFLVMSLKSITYCDQENGTSIDKKMAWGGYPELVKELTRYSKVPTVREHVNYEDMTSYNLVDVEPENKYTEGLLPRTGKPHISDSDVISPLHWDMPPYNVPSPYRVTCDDNGNQHWDANPFYTYGGKEQGNVLSDFSGKENTAAIISYTDMKHVTDDCGRNHYPAAQCCARFRTDGTKSGDWWLPSMGEMGYFIVFANEINKALQHINREYGEDICAELNMEEGSYWTSTVTEDNKVVSASAFCGYVSFTYGEVEYSVRAVTAF